MRAGALRDAGLTKDDVDGNFCAGDAPGVTPKTDYLNLRVSFILIRPIPVVSSYPPMSRCGEAIAAGKCNVALITLAAAPAAKVRAARSRATHPAQPEIAWESYFRRRPLPVCDGRDAPYARTRYDERATRMGESRGLASCAAQPHAMLRNVVTVEDVLASPMVADPLHRLDCCVVSDGGGALVVVRPEIARSLKRPRVKVIGAGEATKGSSAAMSISPSRPVPGRGRRRSRRPGSGLRIFKYASVYDSFQLP